MKNHTSKFIFLFLIFACTAVNSFADVKIRSKQTTSGQTFENTTFIKGKRQRNERNLGGMQMIDITQCDLKRGIQLNPMTQTYMVDLFTQTDPQNVSGQVPVIENGKTIHSGGKITTLVDSKDTGERRKMFGYDARRIITTMETNSTPDACSLTNTKMQIDGWYIDAAFALDCETEKYKNAYVPKGQKAGCQDKYEMRTTGSGKRGFPVYEKMTMLDAGGKETFSTVTEVIELSQASLEQTLFEIPEGYRQVKDSSEMYSASSIASSYINADSDSEETNGNSNSGILGNSKDQTQNSNISSNVGEKQAGIIRIGIITKTGAVGEGLNPNDLAAAVENTLSEYLKGTKLEIVALEAKLANAIENEAKEKDCDYILFANVSHKKGGGGGFGMFGKVIAPAIGQTGIGHTGSRAGNIAGNIATNTIVSAGHVASNVKAKDEITLEVKLQKGAANAFSKSYKQKAKSAGEDILTPIIEQVAEAIAANAK